MTPSVSTEAAQLQCVAKPLPEVSILLVDDDLGAIQLLGLILTDLGQLRFATNGKDALRLAHESPPHLILLDAEMPEMNGFELLKALKAEARLAEVPVIFITSHAEAGFEVSALELGAADFIAKPFRSSPVLARVKNHLRMKQMADELRLATTTDSLTGIANRRLFNELSEREWLRTLRTGDPMSLLLVDVDYFKRFNDRYGHPYGDRCLREVAQTLVGACQRPADLVARYGGEEFIVLLPQTPRHGAERLAHRILKAVQVLGIVHEDSPTARHVSVSIGIASYDEESACWANPSTEHRLKGDSPTPGVGDLIHAADQALYLAKGAGRAQAQLQEITHPSEVFLLAE